MHSLKKGRMLLWTEEIASVIKVLALQSPGLCLASRSHTQKKKTTGMVACVYDLLTGKTRVGRCPGFSGQLVYYTSSTTETDPVSKVRW